VSQERYDPREAEPRWVEAWLDSGLLRADPDAPGTAYTIAIPPPNVTGALHMGHALNNTIQDVLIRAHRMAGDNVKWICGTDHAGIATQAVVEKALAGEGLTRHDVGREAFLERVWMFKEESGGTIISQLQRLGATLDYSRERFTMDEGYAAAVLRVFVDMYEKGYIYRDRYMVNWDPGLGSAISDLEVEDREVTDRMVQIAYPLAGGGEIVVATVRPETMLGDTAVAVNPADERYRHLIGSACVLPLVGRELPIIGDDYADPAFGTGALKVTPAHDPNDFELSRRHDLEQISVIGEDGRMTDAVPDRYRGLTTAEAAERVLADLRELGAVRGEEPYTHSVPFSHRSGARVEPLISLQWFADMTELARPAIAAVEDGRVRFTGRWADVYLRWMREIRPWCLSRQLWWGHQLPVWYRGEEIHVGLTPPEGKGWERDPDVLDTWFSSALWPFATLGWPDRDDPELSRYYPGDVLSTARDIIFLWVARMVMMGMEYMGDVPFTDVYVHPVIQAPDGRRMSKSLGTGIDPVELIDEYGADALRFGLLMMSSTQDVRFSDERIRQGRQLVTKLWNAGRLVIDRGGRAGGPAPVPETLADRWMVSRVAEAVEQAQVHLAAFNFSALADLLYHLIFDELADWYLELLKAGEATPEVAGPLLEQVLALAHPVIPFVTEESWARLPGAEGMMLTHPSAAAPGPRDQAAEAEMARFQELVSALRSLKNTRGLTRRDTLTVDLDGVPDGWADGLSGLVGAELGPVDEGSAQIVPLSFGRALVGAAGVGVAAERARLEQALQHAESELARAERQLANARFVERAPAELVTAEREKRRRFATEREELARELAELADGASARRPT
jgi:valyl-tRNA synthetase